jgi:hypothetical protein
LQVAALFGAVATVVDVTPTTAMVFAGIDKKPATPAFVGTLTNPLDMFGGQEIYGREGNDR